MSSNNEQRGNGNMLKGCQRKIIVMKNTGSNIFEEAYFVLRENAVKAHLSEIDMIEEANRIIRENSRRNGTKKDKTGYSNFRLDCTLSSGYYTCNSMSC